MSTRDEFSDKTKDLLAKRVGTLCSNPQCGVPTYGPSNDLIKAVNKGVAAHIKAARRGGPRYDPEMTPDERKSLNNGIWLCQSCAKLIDSDETRFSDEVLYRWKKLAEDRAEKALSNPRIVNFGPDFADTILFITRQKEAPGLDMNNQAPDEWRRMKIEFRPVKSHRDIMNPSLPIVFKPGLLKKGECLIYLACQNLGTGIDQFIKIDLQFEDPAILSIIIDNPSQVQLINGGGNNANFASFKIRDLLPMEDQGIKVIAKDNVPFSAELWSQNSGQSNEVFIADVVFGQTESVPREKLPPWAR